ncbi:MAG: VIT1/CCC1 transporter family protein [Chlamydiales bacterium]
MNKHFENQDPLSHVIGKRAQGRLSIPELHGTEMASHLAAGLDAICEMAILLTLLSIFSSHLPVFIAFGCAIVAWTSGRSGWLGWARLERLHRLIEQEKYEIDHHRPQEREELIALYQAKGLEGKLLNDVVDTLMADQDRLLKVMLEEEMGLTLQTIEHPLKQCLGAAIGSVTAFAFSLTCFLLLPYGILIASFLLITGSSMFSALYEKNRPIPAIIWNLSIGMLGFGIGYFLFQILN